MGTKFRRTNKVLTSTWFHLLLTGLYIAAVVMMFLHGLVFPAIVFIVVTLLSLYNLGCTLRRRENVSQSLQDE